MRDFLNAILTFIGATPLTDGEFATVTISIQNYSIYTYNDLLRIVDSRGAVGGTRSRLKAYFVARGIEFEETGRTSNLYLGDGI